VPEGIDYAFGRPSIAALRKAGVKFVCRYLSHSPSKNLTASEARQLSTAGIWIVVVWETTAQRALGGRTAGVADATDAMAQSRACGMPSGRPIYFAVDWDAATSQQGKINAYLDGAASVLGKDRVGIYGGYGPVRRAMEGGHAAWGWQTYAWSGGRWYGRAQLQQYSNDHTLGGIDCDYDRATKADYGQWRVGGTPNDQEDDVAEVTSISATRQTAQPGSKTPVKFSQIHTDKHHLVQKDGLSILVPKSAGKLWAHATANLTLSGMQPGEPVDVAWTLIVQDEDGDWQEAYQNYRDTWHAGPDGTLRRTLPGQFGLDAASRLQLRLYPGASEVVLEECTADVTLLKF
jgi:hypothetical protein